MNTQKTTNNDPPQAWSPAAHHKTPFPEETDQIWTEAGFLPSAGCCQQTVAPLHRLAMADEPMVSRFLPAAVQPCEFSRDLGHTRGCQIPDPRRLRRITPDCGIEPAGRGNDEVAHAVALAIIDEYGDRARLPADLEARA